jgi:hypothetical protein
MNCVAANYITLGDEVRINPRYLDGYYRVTAVMQVEGMLDDWSINVTYPQGIMVKLVSGIEPMEGMTIGYVDRFGQEQVYDAPLQVSANYSTISSHISVMGYWDYDGDGWFDQYGTAKWMPGEYDMFSLNLYVSPEFRSGDIIFDGTLTSGADQRGAVLQGVRFYRTTHVWVGYMLGDVTGNEKITIDDVSELMGYLLTDGGLDEFQLAAADMNQDGVITIDDATAIINYLLTTD